MTQADVLKRERAKASREHLELALLQQIRAAKLPEPERQFRFHPTRRWRADFAWHLGLNVILEVDGGTWSGGRHTRGSGYAADCEKVNEAAILGYAVLRVTGDHIKSGQAIGWLQRALK